MISFSQLVVEVILCVKLLKKLEVSSLRSVSPSVSLVLTMEANTSRGQHDKGSEKKEMRGGIML